MKVAGGYIMTSPWKTIQYIDATGSIMIDGFPDVDHVTVSVQLRHDYVSQTQQFQIL